MPSASVDFRQIEASIERAMRADQFRLSRQLRTLREVAKAGRPFDRLLAKLNEQLDRSLKLRDARQAAVPAIRYDDTLPIVARREEIAEAIRENQVVVVSGETGSGKSTQLPKICLELGRGLTGMIGHTQPRRIAARSIAARLAEELAVPLGREVGFKIRFADSTGPQTLVKLMTDGILLAETQGDRFLEQYDTIILDEAHERSLNIDFLIGYLKRLLPKRPDLKVIITSATIDSVRFARHFRSAAGNAPVIEVSGRAYPVEIRYRPLEPTEEGDEPQLEDALLAAVDELARIDTGDILIFMPTERHIHDTAKALRGHRIPRDSTGRATEIVPLYARLPAGEQQKIFQPHSHRRIVIATNVAESSLTVPGIRYVIDPGTARISRYSPRSKTQRLPIEAVSQASADQRKGRCGRVGPGICTRLFSEDDYTTRDRYTPPEILRSNLASVILQTKALKLGAIESFPFLDPPRSAAVSDGYRTLFELGALDERRQLTPLGQRLSRLPVDPRIGRMIVAADEQGCLSEMLVIAAALEIRDPRDRPVEKQEKADQKHAKFLDADSDFLSYLRLWDFYHDLKKSLSRSQLQKACRQNFLSYNRMREWLDIHLQLRQLVAEVGLRPGPRRDEYDAIHRAILTGLLSNIACRNETNEYTAAGGSRFVLWPGSGVFEKKPRWVVAAELVETSRRFLRTVARINPDWIEPLAEHLVKRSHSDPQWHRESGSAVVIERVALFGLPIAQRHVAFGPVNPTHARQMLIQHGLIEGELDTSAPYFAHNQRMMKEVERLQAKLRRHDLMLGELARFDFYDARLPEDVYDLARLDRWRRDVERTDRRALFMSQEDLLRERVDGSLAAAFPDTMPLERNEMPLDYRFEPGSPHDGVTVTVPVETLHQVDQERLGWLVPGLLEPKVTALIKSLPKPIRRNLVPAPDTARKVVARLRYGQGDLLAALAAELSQIAGQAIPVEAFEVDKLPDELRMNLCVVDSQGTPLAAGRDVKQLRRTLKQETSASLAMIEDPRWSRDGLTEWDLDELPEETAVRRGSLTLKGYPMLVDRGDSVSLHLADTLERAEHETRRALRRLFVIAARRELKTQVDWLPGLNQMAIHAASLRGFDLKQQLAELLAARAFFTDRIDEPIPRTKAEYEKQLGQGRKRIVPAVQEVTSLVATIFEAHHRARLALEEPAAVQWEYAVADMKAQLVRLLSPDFLAGTPWNWLEHFPRYLRAIPMRLDKIRGGGLARDRELTVDVVNRQEAYLERKRQHDELDIFDPELERYRWMLEEYRVSLFAQHLGTAMPVSGKRLDKQWDRVRTE
jgi:ATP-dependent helicase HrpA